MFYQIILPLTIFFGLSFSYSSSAIENFSHESEFSSVASRGNAPYETYNTKTFNRVVIDKMHDVTFGAHYSFGTIGDDQEEIARNWDVNAKYLTAFTKKSYLFLGGSIEGNEYAGFTERNNIDFGVNTKYINQDSYKIYFEYGYRQTIEVPNAGDIRKDQKLRLYLKIDDKLTQNSNYSFWIECIPNLTNNEDYMINFEPSFRVSINSILFLKVAYKGMYDNLPAIESRKYYDELYTTSLLAKF